MKKPKEIQLGLTFDDVLLVPQHSLVHPRDVAVKTLPQELARDAERLARCEQEAKTLAATYGPKPGIVNNQVYSANCKQISSIAWQRASIFFSGVFSS